MARRREGKRVLGPYAYRRGWRLVVVGEDGTRDERTFATEAEAKAVKRELTRMFDPERTVTIKVALDRYEGHMRRKGNKEKSIDTTLARLNSFFTDGEDRLRALSEAVCGGLYEALQKRTKVDTHRNTLAEAKTFLNWSVRERLLDRNPASKLEGQGKRRRGKDQLRIDEARAWMKHALTLAQAGKAGAVAALVALLMGLRATEIVSRQVRDLDDGGRLLWIPEAKTEAGKRKVEVPEVLRPLLLTLVNNRPSTEPMFGNHWRDWPRKWVQRICKESGVPKVTAHGMRGLHATLAEESGVTAHVVASALGHESATTTHGHYTDPSAVTNARARRTFAVLQGGA